jgi:hypothetical protein
VSLACIHPQVACIFPVSYAFRQYAFLINPPKSFFFSYSHWRHPNLDIPCAAKKLSVAFTEHMLPEYENKLSRRRLSYA